MSPGMLFVHIYKSLCVSLSLSNIYIYIQHMPVFSEMSSLF